MQEDQEPEGLPEAEGAGDPAPPTRRGPGRPRGSRNRKSAGGGGSGSDRESKIGFDGDLKPPPLSPSKAPATRASKGAVEGAESLYGLAGGGVQLAGNVTATPGLVAGGWVMQAQAKSAGPVIAKRLLNTRWYPYLERVNTGGDLAALVLAPAVTAVFVQVAPLRPILAGVLESLIGSLTLQVPDESGMPQVVNLWQAIAEQTLAADAELEQQRQAAQAAAAERAAAMAAQTAAANGAGDPSTVVEPPAGPEPDTDHESPYTRFRDAQHEPPPEI